MEAPSPDFERLVAQRGWVLRLARRLVGQDDADDLVQDAYVAALRRPPTGTDERVLRAWFSRVVTNLARSHGRADARRSAREEAHATDARTDDPAVQEAEPSRRLVSAVMALGEPSRSAILLRYVEGRTYEELAASMGASPTAARKRVSRAVAQLRERLDQDHGGDRRAWTSAVGAWLGDVRGSAPPAAAVGGLAAGAKLGLALLAAALVATAVFLFTSEDRTPTPAGVHVASPAPSIPALAPPGGNAARDEASPARGEAPTPAPAAPVAPTGGRLWGRVTDQELRPLPGATVALRLGDDFTLRTTAGHDGTYHFVLDDLPAVSAHLPEGLRAGLTADAPGFLEATWLATLRGTPLQGKQDIALRAGFECTGRVVDGQGRPRRARVCAFAAAHREDTRADEEGRFRMPLLVWNGLRLTAEDGAAGFVAVGPFDPPADRDFDVGEVVLVQRARLAGVVVTPSGDPVPDVLVRALPLAPGEDVATGRAGLTDDDWRSPTPEHGRHERYWELAGLPGGSLRADAQGRFSFEALAEGRYALETASPIGAEVDRHGAFETGDFARLVTEHRAVVLRVVDQAGLPLPGALVNLAGDEWATTTGVVGPHATFEAEVTPGRWTIAAGMPGATAWSHEFEVTEDTRCLEFTATLDLAAATGRLALTVVDERGATLEDPEVILSPVIPGWRGRSWSFFPSEEIPVGEYAARVSMGRYGGNPYFPELLPLTIRADETTTGEVTLRRGARLELVLTGVEPEHRERADTAVLELDRGDRVDRFDVRPSIEMIRPQGGFGSPGLFGEPQTSELLEPGTATLRVRVEGYEPAERVVVLVAGETSALTLQLTLR